MAEENLEIKRVNPLCVISIGTYGEYNIHDIQTNSAWSANPYEDYVIVPDNMVQDILKTKGFCDITLNEDGTEVASFVALEVPVIPEPVAEATVEERVSDLELSVADLTESQADTMYELSLMQLGLL